MSETQEPQFESNACDQCYRTKQTCTKNVPSCQRCLKNSSPCTYSFGRFMGKPKKRYKNRFTEEKSVMKQTHPDAEKISERKDADFDNAFDSPKGHITGEKEILDHASIIRPALETLSKETDGGNHADSLPAKSIPRQEGKDPKRRTSAYACDQCHRFKVKCSKESDGAHCKRCTSNGNTCTFSLTPPREDLQRLDTEIVWNPLKRNQNLVEQDDWTQSPKSDQIAFGYSLEVDPGITDLRSTSSKRRKVRDENRASGEFSSESSIMSHGYSFTADDTSLGWEHITWSPGAAFSSTSDLIAQNFDSENGSKEPPVSQINEEGVVPKCSCVSSVLSTLKGLHNLIACVGTVDTFSTRSLDDVLCTTRDALSACKSFKDCKICHNPLRSILCATVLQKLFVCYKILGSSNHSNETGLSIKIGGVEFSNVTLYPQIIRGILEGEKKKAAAVCESLMEPSRQDKWEGLQIFIASQQGEEDDEEAEEDGIRALLQLLVDRFLALDILTD
ncbi:hypothetical protein BGZ60DRAFT_534950 [Tricladium varicosporioides]|nr:hypothetical protein BGZ60DRAFT_534950 [Hymenoscyphus varicosporioides]